MRYDDREIVVVFDHAQDICADVHDGLVVTEINKVRPNPTGESEGKLYKLEIDDEIYDVGPLTLEEVNALGVRLDNIELRLNNTVSKDLSDYPKLSLETPNAGLVLFGNDSNGNIGTLSLDDIAGKVIKTENSNGDVKNGEYVFKEI